MEAVIKRPLVADTFGVCWKWVMHVLLEDRVSKPLQSGWSLCFSLLRDAAPRQLRGLLTPIDVEVLNDLLVGFMDVEVR